MTDTNNNLNDRRAKFVYAASRLAAIAAKAPIIPDPWEEREQIFKDQFKDVIEKQCSELRSGNPEDLHNSWMKQYKEMGWKHGDEYNREKKTHPDLVPYDELEQREQDKDSVFIELCEIARQWIY